MSTFTPEQILQQAIAHHRAGELQQAEQLYRAILKIQPNHPDANHNLGVLAVTVNKAVIALPFFKTALETNPNQGQFWLSYIDALIKAKQLDTAKTLLAQGRKRGLTGEKIEQLAKQLIALAPKKQSRNQPSDAQINQLVFLFNQGNYHKAEKQARNLIRHYPKHGFGWKALGAVLPELGRLEDALTAQRKSVELSPHDADALYNLGNTLKALHRLNEAEQTYRLAITYQPNYAAAYNNLGLTLQELGHLTEAEKNYRLTSIASESSSRDTNTVVPHPATRYWRSQPFAGAGVRRLFPPRMLRNAMSWPPLTWGIFNHLDTCLRRYDTVFSNGSFWVNALRKLWRAVRRLSGDDGYECYLAYHAAAHPDIPALSRKAWFAYQQHQKWSGIKRCC